MDFFLKDDTNGTQLHFPVNPGEVTIRREKMYETVTIMTLGETDFKIGEKIKEFSFASFFPAQYDPDYCRYPELPAPSQAMQQLIDWTNGGTPVRFIITGLVDINELVMVSSHTNIFKGGEPGDIYFNITCRTWREIKVKSEAQSGTNPNTRADMKPVPKVYTVKTGETLWAIAKQNLGSGSRWPEIYKLNTKTIGPNPDLIIPGQKLVLPV
jgi:nucleoid-associated protein YgaU